jgi:hypothetical protein
VIETVAALVALMAVVQGWMIDPAVAWPAGRSWAYPTKLTDAQLRANVPACCGYVTVDGVILRVNNTVFLVKGAPR